jgi:hypothetical protein
VGTLIAVLGLAAIVAIVWGVLRVIAALAAVKAQIAQSRPLELLALFAPAVVQAANDPRTIIAWHPMAATARTLYPDDFAALDRAAGVRFPFHDEQIHNAHSRWTADWLAWEYAHDSTYKLKTAQAEADLAASGGAALARARLDAIEREKLELYQVRYEQYVKVAKALMALTTPPAPVSPARPIGGG